MHHSDRDYLFYEGDLSATLQNQLAAIKGLVEKIPREQFLATTIDTLVDNIASQLTIDELVLHEDQIQMEHQETKIDVSRRFEYGGSRDGRTVMTDGHRLVFFVPFSGEAALWGMRPNTWSSVIPQGQIDKRRKILTLSFSNTSNTAPDWYQSELNSSLAQIRNSIESQRVMLTQYRSSLPSSVRQAIQHRRDQVEKLQGLTAAFNIPMVKKPGMPEYRPVDIKKTTVRALPKAPPSGFKPEPAIASELYEEILSNIRHMGATFEGTPQTYLPLGEEGLRDILMASLNGVYQGAATAEAFRKYGKTDIRIEEESRAAFVGECKFWGGKKVLTGALEQLLDYTTWRDCKSALIIFNRDVAGFSSVQNTIAETLPEHPLFLRTKQVSGAGEWRHVFRSKEDEGREVSIHVFCFNLHVTAERATKRR